MTSRPVYAFARAERNPEAQHRIHSIGVVYWLINFPVVTVLFFAFPAVWLKLGLFVTLIYSVYANFATNFTGMSAAQAASSSAESTVAEP